MSQTPSPLPYAHAIDSPVRGVIDQEHLKLLAIFSYIWGGLSCFFSLFGLMYVFMGVLFVNSASMFAPPPPTTGPAFPVGPPPQLFGTIFIVIGSCFIAFFMTVGILNLISAGSMQVRKRRMLSLIVAGVNCAFMPIGTALGVFSFIVLLRQSVRGMYLTNFQNHF